MQEFFRIEGPVYRVLLKIWNLLVLNLLMFLTSLPIITIGAAQTAGFTVTTSIILENENQIIATYFESFKKNFRQSTAMWILGLVFMGVLVTNWFYLISFQQLNSWLTIGVLIVTLMVLNFFQFVFFYISRFENSIKEITINLIKLSLKYPLHSLLLLIFSMLPMVLMLLSPYLFVFGMYISIFIGISFMHFLRTYLLLGLFKRLEKSTAIAGNL